MWSIGHRRHSITTCDDVMAHRRRSLGGRDDGLLLQNLPYSFRGVDNHPVIPAHANLKNITVFHRPFAKESRCLGGKFVADANQWVPFEARYRIKPGVTAQPCYDDCRNAKEYGKTYGFGLALVFGKDFVHL